MPNLVVHYQFGREVYDELHKEIQEKIDFAVYDFAILGPDVWFSGFCLSKERKDFEWRCDYMHKYFTGQFLDKLLKTTACSQYKELLFSYLAGFLCHYCLDCITHPYILYYTGNQRDHVRLELALDSYMIRTIYRCPPWKFSSTKRLLKLNALPKEISEDINYVYSSVYGWQNTFEDINKGILNQKRFYDIVQDPIGLVNFIIGISSRLTKNTNPVQTYFHKDVDSSIDYFNVQHGQWLNPYDSRIVSKDSFFDLYDKAKSKAEYKIKKCFESVFMGKSFDYKDVIENLNYYSNLPWDDVRSKSIKVTANIFNR